MSARSFLSPGNIYFFNRIYLGATDGDVDSNLFVTTDTEGTDGVTGLAWRNLLEDNLMKN
jgi:hypothetical protein